MPPPNADDRRAPHAPLAVRRTGSALVLIAVLLLGFNLRPTAVSIGPVLPEVRDALGLSSLMAGILTSLPVVAFGVFGALAPGLASRWGTHRVTTGALALLVMGLLARAVTPQVVGFFGFSLVALAGMAAANVLLPSLVKQHFGTRIGAVTAAYTTALALGVTASAALTAPIMAASGSWQLGLGVWAAPAVLGLSAFLAVRGHDGRRPPTRSRVSLRDAASTRLGWTMALLFAAQSAQAYTVFGWFAQLYRDEGFSETQAGLLLAVVTGVAVPVSLIIPGMAARMTDQSALLMALVACYPVGYLGLAFWPVAGAYLWAVLVGVGGGVFPLTLTLIALRSRTAEGTAALSGFTQSVGYVLAALGPVTFGGIYETEHGAVLSLLFLTSLAVLSAVVGRAACRPVHLEDQLIAL